MPDERRNPRTVVIPTTVDHRRYRDDTADDGMLWKATTLLAGSAGIGVTSLVAQATNVPDGVGLVATSSAIGTCIAALAYVLRLFLTGQLISRPTEQILQKLEELARQGSEREAHLARLVEESHAIARQSNRLAAKRTSES